MMTVASPCRTYIVYRNGLFAQGVRSILEHESGVQIVGMENDLTRATTALRALQPEVILVEEDMGCEITWPFLEAATDSRIVTFSLHHAYATVYDPRRIAAGAPADLVKAIQGVPALEELPDARTDSREATASTADRLTADKGNNADRIGPVSQPEPGNGKD
jgi:DNA-binding NarL/FixJ family response regulator